MTPIRKYSHANIDLWFYDCGKQKFNSFLMNKNLLKHFVEKSNIKMIPFLSFRLQVRIILPLLTNKDLNYGKLGSSSSIPIRYEKKKLILWIQIKVKNILNDKGNKDNDVCES